ncbi:MAG: class I SAM-dependent methyltransferase [Chromatiaceae bacterium]|nr:MAG: class I SAM-dependent methyltransferase [Chromatiaceae bacterium]
MKRRPEPELMDTQAQAEAYAGADFTESNALFLRLLAEQGPGELIGARALDLGCGPADIMIRFLARYPQATCDALDGSEPMLAMARSALAARPGVVSRARLICDKLPSAQLPYQAYDLILSNSLLHHLHEPQVLWRTVRAAGKPGAIVLIMDLMRPASVGWAAALVESYAGGESEVLRQDFLNSLFASFEPAEVTQQLREAQLDHALAVHVVSDRHLAVWGRLP